MVAVKGDAKSETATVVIPFRQEREVSVQLDKEASSYDYDEQLHAAVSGQADIFYAIDYLDRENRGVLTDVTRQGTLADGEIPLSFQGTPDGGTLVLQAVAMVDGEVASPVVRRDMVFAAENQDAFLVDGVSYSLFGDALAAVENSAASSILYLQKDAELGGQILFPRKTITIASTGSAVQYRLKADSVQLQQDILFSNLQYDIGNLYANGHSVTIAETVNAPFALLGHRIFAGSPYRTDGINTLCPAELATVRLAIGGSGSYAIYGSGAVGTALENVNVEITAAGITGKAAGAIWGSSRTGTVTLNGATLTDDRQVEVGEQGQ